MVRLINFSLIVFFILNAFGPVRPHAFHSNECLMVIPVESSMAEGKHFNVRCYCMRWFAHYPCQLCKTNLFLFSSEENDIYGQINLFSWSFKNGEHAMNKWFWNIGRKLCKWKRTCLTWNNWCGLTQQWGSLIEILASCKMSSIIKWKRPKLGLFRISWNWD